MHLRRRDRLARQVRAEGKALAVFIGVGMVYGWAARVVFFAVWTLSIVFGIPVGGWLPVFISKCFYQPVLFGAPTGGLAGLFAGISRRMTILWIPIGLLAGTCLSALYAKMMNGGELPNSARDVVFTLLPTLIGVGTMTAARADYHGCRRLPFMADLWKVEHDEE